MDAETALIAVGVVVTLYVAVDVFVWRKQRQLINLYRERTRNLTAVCKEFRTHATECLDRIGLKQGGDYSRRLSKLITEADAAIQDK